MNWPAHPPPLEIDSALLLGRPRWTLGRWRGRGRCSRRRGNPSAPGEGRRSRSVQAGGREAAAARRKIRGNRRGRGAGECGGGVESRNQGKHHDAERHQSRRCCSFSPHIRRCRLTGAVYATRRHLGAHEHVQVCRGARKGGGARGGVCFFNPGSPRLQTRLQLNSLSVVPSPLLFPLREMRTSALLALISVAGASVQF